MISNMTVSKTARRPRGSHFFFLGRFDDLLQSFFFKSQGNAVHLKQFLVLFDECVPRFKQDVHQCLIAEGVQDTHHRQAANQFGN